MRAPSAADLGFGVALGLTGMRGRRERRIGEAGHARWIGRDQRDLALVPFREQFWIGQTADQAGMDEAGEIDAGHVARGRVEALDVPYRFLRQRKVIGEKAAAVLLGEEAVEAPEALLQRTDVEQVDHQQVAGLGALDADRAGQEVHDRQVDVAHVVGGIIVLDEAAGPVVGLDDEIVAGLDPGHDRNVRMPAVVDHVVVVGRFAEIDLDQCLWHQKLPFLPDNLPFTSPDLCLSMISSENRCPLFRIMLPKPKDTSRSARHRRPRADRRGRSRRSR